MLSFLGAVQAEALRAVLEEDPEEHVRSIQRWYSRTFFTPLHEVDDLSPEFVFQAWFESRYEKMAYDELIDEARLVVETPAQREARLKLEKDKTSKDDEFMKALEKKLIEDAAIEAKKPKAPPKHRLVTNKLPPTKAPPKVAAVPADPPPIKVEFKNPGEPFDIDDDVEPV